MTNWAKYNNGAKYMYSIKKEKKKNSYYINMKWGPRSQGRNAQILALIVDSNRDICAGEQSVSHYCSHAIWKSPLSVRGHTGQLCSWIPLLLNHFSKWVNPMFSYEHEMNGTRNVLLISFSRLPGYAAQHIMLLMSIYTSASELTTLCMSYIHWNWCNMNA